MILILGAKGYLGGWTAKIFKNRNISIVESNLRLENLNDIRDTIVSFKCSHVICAAGISGKPTIEWCEEHSKETFETNVLDILNLVKLCNVLDVHVTIYGSGLVYSGKKNFYTEEDEMDYTEMVYSKYRILLEYNLKMSPYKNWLYLRIIFPCSFDGNSKCFYEKLKVKPYIYDISVPITIVPYMFELLPNLLNNKTIGIYNFVNKGTVHLSRLNRNAIIRSSEIKTRGAYELDTEKLQNHTKKEIMKAELWLDKNVDYE